MSEEAEKEFKQAGGLFALWSGLLIAPFAFLLNLQVSYMLVPFTCATGRVFWLHVAAGGSLMLAVLGLFIAWRNWRKTGREWHSEAESIMARSRFLSVMGLLMSALFCLAILAQWIANFIIGPCQP
jgi:small-conductance mechanosensitive channel